MKKGKHFYGRKTGHRLSRQCYQKSPKYKERVDDPNVKTEQTFFDYDENSCRFHHYQGMPVKIAKLDSECCTYRTCNNSPRHLFVKYENHFADVNIKTKFPHIKNDGTVWIPYQGGDMFETAPNGSIPMLPNDLTTQQLKLYARLGKEGELLDNFSKMDLSKMDFIKSLQTCIYVDFVCDKHFYWGMKNDHYQVVLKYFIKEKKLFLHYPAETILKHIRKPADLDDDNWSDRHWAEIDIRLFEQEPDFFLRMNKKWKLFLKNSMSKFLGKPFDSYSYGIAPGSYDAVQYILRNRYNYENK